MFFINNDHGEERISVYTVVNSEDQVIKREVLLQVKRPEGSWELGMTVDQAEILITELQVAKSLLRGE